MVADTPVPSPQPTVHPSIQPTALPTLPPTLKPTNYPTFSIDSSKISMGAVESPVMRANTLEVNLLVVSGDTFDARRLRRRLGHAGIGGPLGEGMSGEGDEHWEFAAPEERGEGARFSAASAVEGLRAEVRALAEIVGAQQATIERQGERLQRQDGELAAQAEKLQRLRAAVAAVA